MIWSTSFCHALSPRLCFSATLIKSSRKPIRANSIITASITRVSVGKPFMIRTTASIATTIAMPPIVGVPDLL